jgi:hypothetical protein
MRKVLERRLQAVEIEQTDTITEVWIEQGDNVLRGPRGETITRDAFAVVCSHLALIVILPDNGRDAKRS